MRQSSAYSATDANAIVRIRDLNVYYGNFHAVGDVTFSVPKNQITALIGPSGCGKSTVLRCINRMNDLVPTARVEGKIEYHGDRHQRPERRSRSRCAGGSGWSSRSRIPFPKSIYENIAWGAKINGYQGQQRRAGRALPAAGRALGRSQGQAEGERARALRRPAAAPVHRPHPGDQPGRHPDGRAVQRARSDLDPKIEDLMRELERHYTIVIVTHNMQQAAASPTRPSSSRSASSAGHAGRSRLRPGSCSPTRATSEPRITSPAASASPTSGTSACDSCTHVRPSQ